MIRRVLKNVDAPTLGAYWFQKYGVAEFLKKIFFSKKIWLFICGVNGHELCCYSNSN